jgi:hypothetical protein
MSPFSPDAYDCAKREVCVENTLLRYANNEIPAAGDRIRNADGGLGTVTTTWTRGGQHAEPNRVTVKWDEGVIEIEYDSASRFTLISRASQRADSFEKKSASRK